MYKVGGWNASIYAKYYLLPAVVRVCVCVVFNFFVAGSALLCLKCFALAFDLLGFMVNARLDVVKYFFVDEIFLNSKCGGILITNT